MTILIKKEFNNDDKTVLSSLKYLPEDKEKFLSCKLYDTVQYKGEVFFPNLDSKFLVNSYMADKNTGLQIEKYNNVTIKFPIYGHTIFVQHCYIFENSENIYKNLNKVFVALNENGKMSFQHFLQDTLHYIVSSFDLLKNDSEIDILLPDPFASFKSVKFIINEILGLKNKIVFVDTKYTEGSKFIKIKELYCCKLLPKDYIYSCPPCLRRDVHKKIMGYYKKYETKEKYVVYFTRKKCRTRKVLNENELINYLKIFSKTKGLVFKVIDTSEMDYQEIFKIMYNSDYIIAPHGGSNYNTYWCRKGTKFLEICCTQYFHSVLTIAQSIGLDYAIYPVNGVSHYGPGYKIQIEHFKKVFKLLN